MLQRGHSSDKCDLAVCKYDLRKGDLFVLSWARVQRVNPPAGAMSSVVILGPILFMIFINDMHDKITSMIHLFADDKTNPMTSKITLPD